MLLNFIWEAAEMTGGPTKGMPNTNGTVYLTVTKLAAAPSALDVADPHELAPHRTLVTTSGAAVQDPADPIEGNPCSWFVAMEHAVA